MALAKCNDCGGAVSTEAKACPRCGRPTPPPKAKFSVRRVLVMLAIVFVPFLIWAYFAVRDYERMRDRAHGGLNARAAGAPASRA